MTLSAAQATAVGGSIARGAANAERLATSNPQRHEPGYFDVWSHTHDGLAAHMRDFAADPSSALSRREAQERRMREAMSPEHWQSASGRGALRSIGAQYDSLGEQVTELHEAQGALQTVGATFQLLTSIEQMLSTLVSVIPFPAFPAVRITDMDVGLPHAHMHPPNLTPPNPVPLMLPSTGPVIPIPILSGASKTLINMMPAARCGDMGIGVWCGGYFPMYEIFLGSSSVWIEGQRAARVGVDITKHCIFTTPRPSDPPAGPMVGFTYTSSPDVMIGGVPMPSLTSLAIGAAIKGLFKGLGKVLRVARSSARELFGAAPAAVRGFDEVPEHLRNKAYWELQQMARDPQFPLSQRANQLHELLNDTSRFRAPAEANSLFSAYPTTRVPLGPEGIHSEDLLALSRRTGLEHGVTIAEDGQLYVVRGGPNDVPVEPGDHVIAHTHPHNTPPSGTDVEMARRGMARDPHGEQTGVALGHDGQARHYDHTGPLDNPSVTPIDPNTGHIDGFYRDPQTGEIVNSSPNFQQPVE
jgi:uncharacterized Zn-binding protein involved in type VI secretion